MTEIKTKPYIPIPQLLLEKWQPITGFESFYEISNYGRVKGLLWHGRHGCYPRERLLKPRTAHRGYLRVKLSKKGKSRILFIHRLVAFAFLPPPRDGQTQVNHKDGIQWSNHESNLEWVTPEENIRHAHKLGLFKKGDSAWQKHKPENIARGSRHGRAKITEETAILIKHLLLKNLCCREIASSLSVSHSCVQDIKSGRSWRHV